MGTPVRVLAWDRAELEEIVSPDVGQMLKRRGVAHFVPCGDDGEFTDMDLPNCILRQGSPTRIHLFIDDIPVMPAVGASQLWAYDPRELWSVEFIRVCNQIRIYTRVFMEQVEGGRVRLNPRLCG